MNWALKPTVLISIFFTFWMRAESLSNSGPVAFGAQLAMSVTNSRVSVDRVIPLRCIIKNASTNLVYLFNPPGAFEETTVTLVSNSGTEHTLSPGFGVGSTKSSFELPPNSEHQWTMPLLLGRDVRPGEYQLCVKRWMYFLISGKATGTNLTCNLANLRVEQDGDSPVKREPGR